MFLLLVLSIQVHTLNNEAKRMLFFFVKLGEIQMKTQHLWEGNMTHFKNCNNYFPKIALFQLLYEIISANDKTELLSHVKY